METHLISVIAGALMAVVAFALGWGLATLEYRKALPPSNADTLFRQRFKLPPRRRLLPRLCLPQFRLRR